MTPRSVVTIGWPALVIPATVTVNTGDVDVDGAGVPVAGGGGELAGAGGGTGVVDAACCGGSAMTRTSTAVPGL